MSKARAIIHLKGEQRREAVRGWVSSVGFEVFEANDAQELGALCERHNPAIVFVEGPLGDPHSVDALSWLRSGGMETPAIIMCGSSFEGRSVARVRGLKPYATCCTFDAAAVQGAVSVVSQSPEMGAVPEHGVLEEYGVEVLLLHALREGFTGQLRLESQGTEKVIFINQGQPVYCSSSILTENFGQMLLRKNVITEIEYNWARKIQQREGIRQGEALVKIGVLKHEALFELLRDQIREKIVNAFGWTRGAFRFEANTHGLHDVTHFALNAVSVVVDGLMRFQVSQGSQDHWRRLSKAWAVRGFDSSTVSVAVNNYLNADARRALQRPQRVGELARKLGWSDPQALAAFEALRLAGYLFFKESPEQLPALVEANEVERIIWSGEPTSIDESIESFVDDDASEVDDAARERQQLSESLWKAYLRVTSTDYFEALGVKRDADQATIVAARDHMLEVYAARHYRPLLDDVRSVNALKDIRAKVRTAAEFLGDPRRRNAYKAQLEPATEPQDERDRYLSAEDAFVAGMSVIEHDPRAACRYFMRATQLNPHEAVYTMYLGWAMYQYADGPEQIQEAQRLITRAIAANPLLDDGYVFLGRVFLERGDIEEAIEQAQTALAFNPGNENAAALLEQLGEKNHFAPLTGQTFA